MEWILGVLGSLLFSLFSIIFEVIDMIQGIFQAFAGTGTVYIDGNVVGSGNTGDLYDTGIIYYFLQSDLVRNMFLSILYLAIILLVVFTVMAVLRNMYQPQPKRWQEIIGSAIKGLGLFIFVPACSLLGVWLGNILLVAIDGATSNSDYQTTISRRLFLSSAYTANHIRADATGVDWETYSSVAALCDRCNVEIRAFPGGENSGEIDPDYEYYAGLVDDCFATGIPSIAANWDVSPWYNLMNINYLLLAAGGIFILYVLGAITFGMVKRLFMLVILFIVSPAVCAMYPIDEGNAYKSWAGEFKKNVLSAYGAVAGMNLFFAVAPLIEMISIPDIGDAWGLLPLALTVAGLYVVKDIINLISGFAGGGNAYSDGAGLMASVNSRRKQAVGVVNKGSRAIAGAFGKATSRARAASEVGGSGAGAFFGSLGGSLLKTTAGGLSALTGKATGIDVLGIKEDAVKGYRDNRDRDSNLAHLRQASRDNNIEDIMKYSKALGMDDKNVEKIFKQKADEYNDANPGGTKQTAKGMMEMYQSMLQGLEKGKEVKTAAQSRDDFRKYWDSTSTLSDDEKKQRDLLLGGDGTGAAGSRVTELQSLLGVDVLKMVLNQATFNADQLDFSKVKATTGLSDDEVYKLISARQAVNTASSEMSSRNERVSSLGKEMAEAFVPALANPAFASSLASNATTAGLTEESIKRAVSDAVNQNNVSSTSSVDGIINALKDVKDTIKGDLAKSQEQGTKEIVKELKRQEESGKSSGKK